MRPRANVKFGPGNEMTAPAEKRPRALTVVEPGFYTLVVDGGRPGHRSLGVPVGGPADWWSWAVGNALVGNQPGAAALEICLSGPTIHASAVVGAVVVGAPFDLSSDRQTLVAGRTFTLEEGETLRIGTTPKGIRAYFCVQGGIEGPLILGSRSSLKPLARQVEISCGSARIGRRFLMARPTFNAEPQTLRTLPGPQEELVDAGGFYSRVFMVTPASDRMGLRLQSEPLALRDVTLVSEPVAPGAVQVTNDGQCIVLGVDGQTIGGYAKVAHVIAVDLDKLGQLRPGQPIRFEKVSLAEAEALHRQKQTEFNEWNMRLRTAGWL